MIKLFAFDLDYTLLRTDKEIDKESIEAINKLKNKNVIPVIASGRPFCGLQEVITKLNLEKGISICFNGNLIIQNDTKKILYRYGIKGCDIKDIYPNFANDPDVSFIAYNKDGVMEIDKINLYSQKNIKDNFQTPIQFNINKVSDNDFYYKMLIIANPEIINKYKDILTKKYQNIYKVISSSAHILEFNNTGISKGSALKEISKILNIDAKEMAAIGDEENDIEMIKYAKIGIAMGNAKNSVKEISNYVTDTCDNLGFSKAINNILL